MKIFLDTANLEEIKKACEWGVVDGATTNPTLLAREIERTGRRPEDILLEICEMVKGPVSAEVTALDADGIYREGKELASLSPYITIKVPMTVEGLKATRRLREEGIMTNMTLVFSLNQAILAAKVGSNFVSPFIGRLDDIGHRGMDLIQDIMHVYENYGYGTEVIVASVRHPEHVYHAALYGADIVTMPFKVFEKLVEHKLTDVGIERFLSDWEKVKDKIR